MTPEHELRLRLLEQDREDMRDAIESIKGSLQALVRLEERHAETREALGRAFKESKDIHDRVSAIEKVIPGLVEMRGWLVKANLGILGLIGLAIIGLVVIAPH